MSTSVSAPMIEGLEATSKENLLALHIVLSDFRHDTRILKETASLIQSNVVDSILIVALGGKDLPTHATLDAARRVWRVPLATRSSPRRVLFHVLKYVELMVRLIVSFWHARPAVVHAHDVAALPLGALLAWKTGAPLVYDAHELESAVGGLSPWRARAIRAIEKRLIPKCARMFVVGEAIADWYEVNLRVRKPSVLRNVPKARLVPSRESSPLRQRCGLSRDDLLFLYQGSFTTGRNVATLLEIFSSPAMKNKHLVFMGYGPLEDIVKNAAKKSSNIHIVSAVPAEEILAYSAGADVGLCLIENTCLSYYYSLPNKLFEYYLAGIPCIASNFPEMMPFVTSSGAGWTVEPVHPDIASFIRELTPDVIREKRRFLNSRNTNAISWDCEAKILVDAYHTILSERRS